MSIIEKPELLDAQAILALDINKPENLFPPDAKKITDIYRHLVRRWHPDRSKSPEADKVTAHLGQLREKAEEKLARGAWQEPGIFSCTLKNGKKFRVRSDAVRPFDLGTLHISPTTATYVVKREYEELFQNAITEICRLKFPDDKMKVVYANRLPITFKTYETEDAFILTVQKKSDEVLLRDLLPKLPADMRGHHVAWMISRMQEFARLLDYQGIAHNAMTLDNLFVSPENHTLSLLGGWWYAKPIGEAMSYAPIEALDYLPDGGGTAPRATASVDLEMVKAAGRELLGDRGGTSFIRTKPAPDAMIAWLRQPASDNAQRELERWYGDVLPKSFGARRFIELPIRYSDIYQPGG